MKTKKKPAKFVQLVSAEGDVLALDEDGDVWRYSQKIGTPKVFGWYRVDMARFEDE
jgi:hypothetical protein